VQALIMPGGLLIVSDFPTISNRYRLLDLLGQGGMGVVYRALDRLTGENVALKHVIVAPHRLQFGSSANANEDPALALAQEFATVASLRHPHIIAVRDYGFDGSGLPFFTMDLLEEPQTIIEAGKDQPASARLQLLHQMLLALVYLHRRGIVHRDLKPGNVLVTGNTVSVVDFGLSVAVERAEQRPVGSLAYMAPEVLSGEPVSPAADLYAVGVIACELFVGRHPFDLADISRLIDQILELPPSAALAGVDDPVAPVLERLLAKAPQERYPDASAVIHALAEATGRQLPLETAGTRESFLQAARFVGRQAELDQLNQALSQAMVGQGSAWLIGGESGVGKSRLVEELRTRALVQGVVILRGQAVSNGGSPYQLWRDMARWLVLLADPDDLQAAVLKPLVPDVAELLARPVRSAPALDPQAAQTRLFAVVGELVRRSAVASPLAILLEDLHWADASSLQLLSWLNRMVADLPLVIVATYRQDEAPDLAGRLSGMHALPLRRLEAESIAELSQSMLGVAGREPDIVGFLHRETEGNVFFVVEVVRALAEEAGQLDHIALMTLPAHIFVGGIQRVVERRLSRLPLPDYPLLQLAAVAGRQIDKAVLQAADRTADIARWLTTCADAAILDVRENHWRFAHDKLREGVLAQLRPDEHALLHRRVGEAIERVYAADLSPHYADLAHHFGLARDTERERHYARLAGEQAADQFANAQAVAYLGRALELTPERDQAARFAILACREKVYDLQGDRQAQADDLSALATRADLLNDDRRRAAVSVRQVNYADVTGDFARAITTARQAIDLAQEAGAVESVAEAHALWGRALWQQADYAGARLHLEEALAMARKVPLPAIETACLLNLGIVAAVQDQYEEARARFEEALRTSRKTGDRRRESKIVGNLGNVLAYAGDHFAARDYYDRSLHLAHEVGDRVQEIITLNNLGLTATSLGNLDKGRTYLEESLRLARQAGYPLGESIALTNLSLVLHWLGDNVAAEKHSRQGLTIAHDIGAGTSQLNALTNLGHALLCLGRLDEAADACQQAVTLGHEWGEHGIATESLAGLAQACLARGDLARAQAHVEDILRYIDANTLQGADDAARVYLTCFETLQANRDARARRVLDTAHALLQERAARISDEATRRSFLENVPSHRALVGALIERKNGESC
jgi:predicted ATPase